MAGNHWTNRVPGPQGLHEAQAAARELSQQAQRNPGTSGLVFQNVAQVVLVGTALISGAVALVHLLKLLEHPASSRRGDHREPEPRDLDHNGLSKRPARGEHQKAVRAAKETTAAETGQRWHRG
jgi:hypothetical protein